MALLNSYFIPADLEPGERDKYLGPPSVFTLEEMAALQNRIDAGEEVDLKKEEGAKVSASSEFLRRYTAMQWGERNQQKSTPNEKLKKLFNLWNKGGV